MKITITATSVHTNTPTGGDKIFVECAKRWIAQDHEVSIITNEAGLAYCRAQGVSKKNIILWRMSFLDRFGVFVSMPLQAILSFVYGCIRFVPQSDITFASSFFLCDMFPAMAIKLRSASTSLATSFYLFSKKAWGTDYSAGKIKGFLFYCNEIIALRIIKFFHGVVLTASIVERKTFCSMKDYDPDRVMAVGGGVDNAFFSAIQAPRIKYDAVFVGRLHPQKCVEALIDIWEDVCKENRARKLAIVGSGQLEQKLKEIVRIKKLEKNVIFLGVRDGVQKAKIIKSSRLFVSASVFDSGNIALDESLACGTPGIVYNLPHFVYPKGVVKIPIGKKELFTRRINYLLTHEGKRKKLSRDAIAYASTIDWGVKADEIFVFMDQNRELDGAYAPALN